MRKDLDKSQEVIGCEYDTYPDIPRWYPNCTYHLNSQWTQKKGILKLRYRTYLGKDRISELEQPSDVPLKINANLIFQPVIEVGL